MRTMAAFLMLSAIPASAFSLNTIDTSGSFTAGTSGISGMEMMDQWGNPWVKITAQPNGNKAAVRALVSIFDCLGKEKVVGEVPGWVLGSADNFAYFKPYLNATIRDLGVIYAQSERRCTMLTQQRSPETCQPPLQRHDCRVVEAPIEGYGAIIPYEAEQAWEAMHPKKKP